MMGWMKERLSPPVFEDPDKTRVAGLLNTMVLSLVAFALIYAVLAPFAYADPAPVLLSAGVVIPSWLAAFWLNRRGRVRMAGVLLLAVLWTVATGVALIYGGVSAAATGTYITIVFAAGLVLGSEAGLGFAVLGILAGFGMLYAEDNGILPSVAGLHTPFNAWIGLFTNLVLAVMLLHLAVSSIVDALDRARRNEQALVESNQALQAYTHQLARREEALRESEARNRALLNAIPDLILQLDRDGGYLDVIPARRVEPLQLPEEMIGKNVRDLLPLDVAQGRLACIEGALLTGELQMQEYQLIRDTERVDYEARIVPSGAEQVLAIVRDITERKRVERELAKAQALLVAAIEQSPAGILIADAPDVNIRIANPAALAIRGETNVPLTRIPAELHPRNWQVYHPDGTPFAPQELPLSQAILAGKTTRDVEAIIRRQDGHERWILANAAPVRNEQGEIVAGVVVFPDITERKQAERALKESEERYRILAELTSDFAYAFYVEPDGSLTPEWVTDSFVRFAGFDLMPDGWIDMVHPEDKAFVLERIEAVLGGESDTSQFRVVPPPGEVRWVRVHSRPVWDKEQERVVRIYGAVQDITARKRKEMQDSRLAMRVQRQHATLVHLVTHPALVEGHLKEALEAIAAAAAQVLEVERTNIWRLAPNGEELHCLQACDQVTGRGGSGRVLPIERYPNYFAALESGRVVDAEDVSTDPRTAELTADYWRPQGIRSSLSAPVRLYGQVVGLVCHDHRGAKRGWTPDEVTFASQVADLVAQTLLSADLRRRADELAAITRVSREITSVPDLPQVLVSIARHAAKLSNSDASGVYAFGPDGRLYLEAGYGVSQRFMQAVNVEGIPLNRGAIGRAVAGRCPIQIPDTLSEPNYSFETLTEMERIRGILAVPMLKDKEIIGGIVLWHRAPRHFDPQEVAFIQALAQQCVNAVENARLFEAEARRRREAETLRASTQALSSTLDLQRVFELILSELQQVVPYDSATVQQLKGQSLEIIGGRGFPNLEELLGLEFDLAAGDNPNLEVVETGGTLILDDAPKVYAEFKREPHAQAGIRSWLGVPLVFGDQLIGMVALDKKEPGFYTPEHARLAQAFAAQAAIALKNAQLFAQEEQRAQELARALEQQQELDYLKDQFIQNVSHELRTPLALIMGYAELLNQGDLGQLQAEQQEPVAVIARRARMLRKLVGDLTAILETETQKAERKPVDLIDLVNNLLADFQVAADRAGLTLTAQIPDELPSVLGDATHLHRVLDNLLGNAFKFTPRGGRVDVHLAQQGDDLVLQVADTGIGIPSEQLDRIFERFYQVDGGMSRRYGGAGLGLALVKEIIEAHGGTVRAKSPGLADQGSTFTVTLPMHVE